MILYLLKHSLCLAMFLGGYRMLVAREKMYTFNRFYLLGTLILATCMPLFTVQLNQTIIPFLSSSAVQPVEYAPLTTYAAQATSSEIVKFRYSWAILLYGVVSLIFAIRFIRNLLHLWRTISVAESIPYAGARLVLLTDEVLPHSFLGYIFINKEDYYTQRIEPQLMAHELTHVQQKHSLDILFIEMLLIVFWFNPFLYAYRKAIKLNHEYLADGKVISMYPDIPMYQRILIAKSHRQQKRVLASSFYHPSIKQRLIMMNKISSALGNSVRKTASIIICLITSFAVSMQLMAQEPVQQQETPPGEQKKSDTELYYNAIPMEKAKKIFYSQGYFPEKDSEGKTVYRKYGDLTPEEIAKLPSPPPPPVKKVPSRTDLNAWLDGTTYGVWLDGKRISNDRLLQYMPSDFGDYLVSKLQKNALNFGEHLYQVDIYTVRHFENHRQEWLHRFGIQ